MNIKHYSALASGAAISMLAAAPVYSADLQVVDLNVQPAGNGIQLSLEMDGQSSTVPQIFTISRNNQTITDVLNTQLNLGDRQKLTQLNPMPGIESIEILQLDPESVRIVATGSVSAPASKIVSRDDEKYVFSFVPGSDNSTPISETSNSLLAQATTTNDTVPTVQSEPEVLFPSPQISNEGKPTPTSADNFLRPAAPVPSFLPRASAPPVGDIAVSTINSNSSNYIDLGTAAVVPRLVLREAPAQDVLALLARSAEMNLVFADNLSNKNISLDLENEPVQDVFNYVLMLSDLEASIRGRTIFVGTQLPDAITPRITRTFRLNQVGAFEAQCYLETGSTSLKQTGTAPNIIFTCANEESIQEALDKAKEDADAATEAAQAAVDETTGGSGGTTVVNASLGGLLGLFRDEMETIIDTRLNSITLTGDAKTVEIASNLLTQLDARKRQVAVNVKILDVTLSGNRSISSDIKLLLEDRIGISAGDGIILSPNDLARGSEAFANFNPNGITIEQGSGTVSFGENFEAFDSPVPANTIFVGPIAQAYEIARLPVPGGLDPSQVAAVIQTTDADGFIRTTVRGLGANVSDTAISRGTNFVGNLVAGLLTNRSSKIVADPTLVIQESESASIDLTEDIIVGVTRTKEQNDQGQTTDEIIEPVIQQVGLKVLVSVAGIDDNGFVSLSVQPEVSGIAGTVTVDDNPVTLTRKSLLQSGLVRLRDDQTLILAGVIDERDSVETFKVPILGDIPIIGSLFRSSTRDNQRRELLFIITPQIIDDSQNATWGYGYVPSDTAQEMLRSERFSTQER